MYADGFSHNILSKGIEYAKVSLTALMLPFSVLLANLVILADTSHSWGFAP